MKSLVNYISERLVINQRFDEKLIINKDYKNPYTCAPKSFEELKKIIEDRYDKLGAGTKQKPIDFNDVDVSNIDSFYSVNINAGIFEDTKFEYIDISDWNVSNITHMSNMFYKCKLLKSVGDLSNWTVSKVKSIISMFSNCKQLKSVGNLLNWDVSNVRCINNMFRKCEQLTSVGDLSNWNVSKVKYMFNTFKESGITNIPDWYRG